MEHLSGQKKPKNWLVESILSTILCCPPFGIAGIIFATRVDSAYKKGDLEAAEKASKQAKKWTLVAVVIGLVLTIIYLVMFGIAGFTAFSEGLEGGLEQG